MAENGPSKKAHYSSYFLLAASGAFGRSSSCSVGPLHGVSGGRNPKDDKDKDPDKVSEHFGGGLLVGGLTTHKQQEHS